MRTWQLVMLRRGPGCHEPNDAEHNKLFKGHFDNMNRFAKLGKLRVSGPFVVPKDSPKDAFAGLFLFDVATRKEALELCQGDPTIKSGVFKVELLTWYGPSDITYRGDTFKKKVIPKK